MRKTDWKSIEADILSRLDIASEAEQLGVRFSASRPKANGWRECYAVDRDEKKPSAAVDVGSNNGTLGKYTDLGGSGKAISFFELASRLQPAQFPDFRAARKHFAEQVGVSLPDTRAPREKVKWDRTFLEPFVDIWCKNKKGIQPDQVKRCRVSAGAWPKASPAPYRRRVLAFFAYRPGQWDKECAIQLYRIEGADFPEVKFKDGNNLSKRKAHTLSRKDGLIVGGTVDELQSATTIWVFEGVTSMLAGAAHLPAGHIAITSIYGANRFDPALAEVARGKDVIVVGDADEAGVNGARIRAAAFFPLAKSVKIVPLPYEVKKSHGKDVRDLVCEGRIDELFTAAKSTDPLTKEDIEAFEAEPGQPRTNDGDVIVIQPNMQPVCQVVQAITNRLLSSGELFRRTEQPVIIRPGNIVPILKPQNLIGVLNEFAEVRMCTGDASTYEPLPVKYANVWMNRISEFQKLPEVRLFTRNPVYTADFRLAQPGFDAGSGIYYDGEPIVPTDSTKRLDELLQDFCWKTPGDRTNYLAMLLTALLISKFIGSKPAVVFNGNQPELGKSILAQIIAIIRDGVQVETATYNPNDEEFEKRLGSIVRRGNTTIIIDNAKATGRVITIESATLERSITDPIVSFRLLGYSTDIRCENSHIFCITANTPEVSRDLFTRSVVVSLYYEGSPTAREFSVADPEGYAMQYRNEILAELCGMVERWKASGMPLASTQTRFNKKGWGNIIGGILAANEQPGFLENASEAAEQMDAARREFGELVEAISCSEQYYFTSADLVHLAEQKSVLKSELGDGSARSKSTRMGILATRYVAERFELEGSAVATFRRREGRKNKEHFVEVVSDDDF